jgi:hypothetical protein
VIRVVVSDLHRHLDLNLGFHDFTIETVLISSIDRSPLRPTLARPLFGDRIDVSNEWILYRGVSVKALIRVDLSCLRRHESQQRRAHTAGARAGSVGIGHDRDIVEFIGFDNSAWR